MDAPTVSYSQRFPCHPKAATSARKWLRTLPLGSSVDVRETSVLLANELMTNSIIHSGASLDIMMEVRVGNGRIFILVRDDGDGTPTVEDAGPTDIGGRGLALVEAMSDRWGYHLDGRTAVWFEIAEAG